MFSRYSRKDFMCMGTKDLGILKLSPHPPPHTYTLFSSLTAL